MENAYSKEVNLIKEAILNSQYQAGKGVNAIQLSLYLSIGKYVSKNTRSGQWGSGAINLISEKLNKELPGLRGFSATNIKNMRLFYEAWGDIAHAIDITKSSVITDDLSSILTLPSKSSVETDSFDVHEFFSIGFTHHIEIITRVKEIDERVYYIHQTYINRWNVLTLKDMLKANIYEHRGKLPNNFSQTINNKKNALKAVEMFKDEYLLDFINVEEMDVRDLQDIDERVVESSIVKDIRKFILCLGASFCFIGNQYRLVVGEEEFFVDLLFYNRDLRCLVAIELKKGKFKPAYLGQLNFYLSALDNQEKKDGENPPVGLLLCKDMDKAVVELAVRDYDNPMGVATYRLPNEVPEKYKVLRPIMEKAQELLEQQEVNEDAE